MAKIHIHTKYSLLDAIIEPEALVQKCVEQGETALCVTEHGNVYSNVELYKLCKKYNIKYMYGCEMYICHDVAIKEKNDKYFHLVVIAKNEQGRLNLNKLVSKSCEYKYYSKPRIDFKMLVEHKEGLIILSACMAGEVQRYLMQKEYQKAKDVALQYKEVFRDDYYLEYQSHSEKTQQILNRYVVSLAEKLGIKYVVTTDAHYLNKEEQKYHSIYVQIGQHRDTEETYNDCYVQSNEEILAICKSTTREENLKAIQTSNEIADKCNVELPLSAPIMPHNTPIPPEYKTEIEYLKHLCINGWYKKKIDKKPNKEEYKKRLAYEIDSIERMGFEGYFLLVDSYCNSVERRGIARGSAGGSLVCYLTNITDIDPIEHKLYFERFIDVGALDLLAQGKITKKELKIPDVDSDFGKNDRAKVLDYVIERYGKDRVVSLGSFQYIWAKGAIKDIGKVLGIPFEITNHMTAQLNKETIGEAFELGLLDNYKDKYPELFVYAEKLAGLPKSFSAHPCFVEDTMILTNSGYKKISNVQIGDMVLTHKNRFKLVVNIHKNQSNTMTIQHTSGFDIECTENHPFYVRHRLQSKQRKYSEPEWVEAKDIIKTDMVCIPINDNTNVPIYKNLPTDNADFWWLIGRYIGDGWCLYYEQPRNTKNVVICCNNNGYNELTDIINRLKGLFDFRYEYNKTTYKIYINNVDLFEYLQRFGKYAYGKHLTNDIFDLPNDLLQSFLDGYISADGYVDKQNYINLKTVSYELAHGIIQCVAKAYHKQCGVHILPQGTDIIEGRTVNRKEKYVLYFQKEHKPKDRCFYDSDNNCIWSFVKTISKPNNIIKDVYNLSVIDDNTYTANGVAVHNCGKVIAMDDVVYYNAVDVNDDGIVILQGDMHTADDLGLIKADFLGLRTVDVIYDTLDMIGKDYEYIAPHNLDFNDKKVLENFRKGYTSGIFQFESPGMQGTLRKIECNSIYDLTVANALYRPGSMKYIDNYANRRKGLEEYEFLHPDLEPILKDSYGIIVFQEQLIEIGRLAKLSNPDELRKATAKKKADLLEKIKPELFNGLKVRGWSEEQLNQLWDSMLDFAKYSFNKSHAAAYAIIAYICMYLKTYHTKEFLCAWINSVSNKIDKISECVYEAKRLNIPIYLGKYNNCSPVTKVYQDGIMMGTNTFRDCNKNIANEIMSLGTIKGTFVDVLDNIKNHNLNIESSQLKVLIGLNFFSDFGNNKYLLSLYRLYNGIKEKSKTILPSFRECKTISKDKILNYTQYGITEFLIKKYSNKETAKQYSQIDNLGLLNELANKYLTNESMDFRSQIEFEMKYLNYTLVKYKIESDYLWVVINFVTYKCTTKPYITLYNLKTGEVFKTKISDSKVFVSHPFGLYSILLIKNGFKEEYKKVQKIVGDKIDWVTSDDKEFVLDSYDVRKDII